MLRNRVRELRIAAGWTQEQLGDKLGVTRQTIISIEACRYMPGLELAFEMRRLFGLATVEELFFVKDGCDD